MLDELEIVSMYQDQNKSTYEIAEYYKTYPNKIRRILTKHGCKIKDRAVAQKLALKGGRAVHPTSGKKRSHEEKVKISSGLVDYWDSLNEEEKNKKADEAKKRWKLMSSEEREKLHQASIESIRKAGKYGSKLERTLLKRISDGGHRVEFHKKNLIPNEKLEIDLYLPDLKTIIEIDGPSHFLPVWGEEKLQKQINADLQKNGLLLTMGFVIIRLKVMSNLSLKKQEDIILFVLNRLKDIQNCFPDKSNRYIEVEL
jgi:very-short-patch-repair endonuclease